MSNGKQEISFDTYRVGEKTYKKDLYLGAKAWSRIEEASPGRFVDILEAKFSAASVEKKININR